MYVTDKNTHVAREVYSAVIGTGKAKTSIWIPSTVKGDIAGTDGKPDGVLTGMDLSVAMSYFGAAVGDADWYSSGAWMVDFNGDGVINIGDLMAEACLIARIPLV